MVAITIILVVLLLVAGAWIVKFRRERSELIQIYTDAVYYILGVSSALQTQLKHVQDPKPDWLIPPTIQIVEQAYGGRAHLLVEDMTADNVFRGKSSILIDYSTSRFIHDFTRETGTYLCNLAQYYNERVLNLQQQNRILSTTVKIYNIISDSEGLKDADAIKVQATDMLKRLIGDVPCDSQIFQEVEDLLRKVLDEAGTRARVADHLKDIQFMLAKLAELGLDSLEPLKRANIQTGINLLSNSLSQVEAQVAERNFAAALEILDGQKDLIEILEKVTSSLASKLGIYRPSPGVLMVGVEKIGPVSRSEDVQENERVVHQGPGHREYC